MQTSLRTLARVTAAAVAITVTPASLFAQAPAASVAPAATPAATATATPKPTPKPRTPADAVTPVPASPARHAQFMYRITQGEIGLLFLGDSITDFWPRSGEWSWLKFAPYHPADFGISGERTEGTLWRITNGELDGIKPKVTVVMIGTNNIGHFPNEEPEWAAAGVQKIVETVHQKLPDTKVLLLGVFPRATKDSDLRKKVAAINAIIAKLDDGKKTRYLDIGKVFLNAEGEIPADVMPDKLHPNAHGYDLWYDAMNPLLSEMLKADPAPKRNRK
ncbi:MAG: GDSL-type esterase/lipase family protein [Chthoniobacteraceae bacterium]|nr:GDSL-type esterase/lipase family protein [Chthoniobacteraceae bacterium]